MVVLIYVDINIMQTAKGDFIELVLLHYELMVIMDTTNKYKYKGKSIKKSDGEIFELSYEILDENNELIEEEESFR